MKWDNKVFHQLLFLNSHRCKDSRCFVDGISNSSWSISIGYFLQSRHIDYVVLFYPTPGYNHIKYYFGNIG